MAEVTFLLGAFLWDVGLDQSRWTSGSPAGASVSVHRVHAGRERFRLYFGSAHKLGPWAVHDYFFAPDGTTALSLALVGVSYAIVVRVGRVFSRRPEVPWTQ